MRFITLAAIAALSLAAACSEQAQDEAGTAVEAAGNALETTAEDAAQATEEAAAETG